MTVVAYRDGLLASDSLGTHGYLVAAGITKIAKRDDGALIGSCGALSLSSAVLRWFLSGESEPRPNMKLDDMDCEALIIRADGKLEHHDYLGWFPIDRPYAAIGSGAEVAYGALFVDATADEAVRAAIAHCRSCGGEVHMLRLGQ